jgi:hypothetical protein
MAGPAGGGEAVGAGADRDGVVDAEAGGGEAGAGAVAGGAALPAEDAELDLFTPP